VQRQPQLNLVRLRLTVELPRGATLLRASRPAERVTPRRLRYLLALDRDRSLSVTYSLPPIPKGPR
jgi:hypothetical protein